MENTVYVLGSLILCYGCIKSEFKKSGWLVLIKIIGFVLMTTAYIL